MPRTRATTTSPEIEDYVDEILGVFIDDHAVYLPLLHSEICGEADVPIKLDFFCSIYRDKLIDKCVYLDHNEQDYNLTTSEIVEVMLSTCTTYVLEDLVSRGDVQKTRNEYGDNEYSFTSKVVKM